MTTPTKDHWPRLLCMHGNVFSGLLLVRIIKVPDKRGPDNRGCTVIGVDSPRSLQNAVFYCNGENFCLQGEECRQLKISECMHNPNGYIYHEFVSKNR